MTKHLGLLIAIVAGLTLTSTAATAANEADQSPTPDISGKWALDLDTGGGTMATELALQQDGKDVTGVFSGLHDMTLKVQGRWDAAELTLSAHGEGHGGEVSLDFKGRLQKDGTLKGTVTTQMGEMTWIARRVPKG